ncbi:hypothetical protein PRUPE_4G249800 [Prunus persica]|uniref:Cyclin-dependent protein kinase inhibitor SMR13 n=1 Tax=Prunus persica TaxID=3760 RepID=M5WK19_PRUPE|nr:cyclin-dependent protein kinase inhibitor SMR13 [Prunus persica]ONI13858.1 hypothetical protein PRUPE_4G249800 [Prunus persica]
MAPSARTRAKTKTTTKARKTNFKKKPVHQKGKQQITPSNSPSNSSSVVCDDPPKIEGCADDVEGPDDVSTSACSTPKGQRFRIPEIVTCPPAPKKQRVISNCLFRRSPIAFFAPPDLELFFYFANGGISV